ncbi:MAG: K(+)-transporting ATPase subunit C [bacterium]|nr:K(+)-transporting ATPase subunit C [bacterium]
MKNLVRELRPALVATAVLTVLLCVVYPVVVWAIAQTLFPSQANGSLLFNSSGKTIGSELIGQPFTAVRYFHPRPSAAGNGYDGASSGGSNLGPLSLKLIDAVSQRVANYREINGVPASVAVPADAVTASASGLDPHISLANAKLQANRVAQARDIEVSRVIGLIEANTDSKAFGILGEDGVNVLMLNLALDMEH